MEKLVRALREAQELERAREWGEAALAYRHGALLAGEAGNADAARQAWTASGEAWRRDDRLANAAHALKSALALCATPGDAALARIMLSGALGELGGLADAERLSAEAAAAAEGPLRIIALDTWITNLQALGRKEEIRPLVTEMLAAGEGHMATAGNFRAGQLCRLDGDLAGAALRFAYVADTLEGTPQAQVGIAAAEAELGEVALLRGDCEDAIGLFERAFQRHGDGARASLMWRAEAARVRAMVEAGVKPLVKRLEEGIAYARARDMVVLEIDLRIARGIAEDGAGDFDAAISLGERVGAVLRAGRARFERATRAPCDDPAALLERAEVELASNEPWRCRARLARARALRERGGDWRELAVSALARFEAMDMAPDAEAARELVGTVV